MKDSLNSPSSLQLLFRASQHDFSPQAFHQKCDDTEDTLAVIRTSFGRTIAGFTHYCWTSPEEAC